MIFLRCFIGLILFAAGLALLVELVISPFNWVNLFGAMVCFSAAYFIWPSKKRNQRDEDYWFLDFLEVLIELPVEIILWIFRILGRIFSGKSNIDIDI